VKLSLKPSLSLNPDPDETQRDEAGINSPRGGPDSIAGNMTQQQHQNTPLKPASSPLLQETTIDNTKDGASYEQSKTDNVIGKEEDKNIESSSESYLIPTPVKKPDEPQASPTMTPGSIPEIKSQSQLNELPAPEPIKEAELILKAPWTTNELLPPQTTKQKAKKCLILDLDETLVHSSFHSVDCDFEIPVDIEGIVRTIYVAKRPHVDEFMKVCGELFEVVVFTASLAKYADPLLDLLDIHKVIDHRLFRESCTPHNGIYVKDLFRIGRPLNQIIIIDNSPHSYAFNPQNAIPCESWFDDRSDTELLVLLEILRRIAAPSIEDVIKEMEALEVSASCSSLDYPFETELIPLQVNESEDEEASITVGETESEGGEATEEIAQWKVT